MTKIKSPYSFYSSLSDKRMRVCQPFIDSIQSDESWLQTASAKFDVVWDDFYAWWSATKEKPMKMSFYAPHNIHWIAQWSVVAHPEIWQLEAADARSA